MLPAPRSPDGRTIREDLDLAGLGNAASIMPVTNAIERRFREVRRRSRPMGTFQDRTSLDCILFAVFIHENRNQRLATPFALTHNS
jgi:transposase-like protein